MVMAATPTEPRIRRFTADEVWRMVEIGLLDEDEPYELIDGELLYVSPQGEPHAKAIGRLTMALAAVYGPTGHVVRVQTPTGGIVDSIPEPDLAVVPADVAEQEDSPRPDQTVLVVECAVTSQRRDRRKGEIYAAAGAPVYWIVDIPRDAVVVHTGPNPDGTWRQIRDAALHEELALPGTSRSITGATILRPRS
jgi:Uma2 family endonuclease